jgi:hypothetical protein
VRLSSRNFPIQVSLVPLTPRGSSKPDAAGSGRLMATSKKTETDRDKPVSLKILADYLGLCPATVSVVLNNRD